MSTVISPSARAGARPPRVEARRGAPLVALMVLAVTAVAALAFWDERREAAVRLDEFALDQATIARSVASELSTRLASLRRDALVIAESQAEGRRAPATAVDGRIAPVMRAAGAPPPSPTGTSLLLSVPAANGMILDLQVAPAQLLDEARHAERPGAVRVLLARLGTGELRATDGGAVTSAPIARGFAAGESSVWLSRAEAAELGLPRRLAAAGLGTIDAGPFGRWGVAVVSSAERVRDHEQRAKWRLVLGVLVAAGLVFLFGTAALRRQRRGLLLERELSLTALSRERDGELATASRAATMGTLAMGVAHEVSTPLGVIAGRAEQLAGRVSGDERAARAVEAILEQTERIRRTIQGFLDMVRGEARPLDDASPAEVLGGAVALVEHRFAAASVLLLTDAPAGLPKIRGDVPMLQQAIVNLLLNACDACAPGGHVAATIESDGARVSFTVTDDGAGITPEAAARATEPFFTTKPRGQGSGLGLAITSEIVKMHRGSLRLAPNAPRGTRATMTIPIPEGESHVPA
jgi:signal transduction histidine kinase